MPAGWAGSEEADCFVKFLVLQDEKEGSLPPPASLQLVLFSGHFNPLLPLLQFTLRLPSFPGAGSGVWALSTALASTPTGCGAQHLCVCVCAFLLFFPSRFFFSDFVSWLTFLPLEEFGKAMRSFFRHDFQHGSRSLTLCLLRLRSNRFHMLLQLTSVLNYFTCDLQYFLRKSVRYLLRANKINLSCSLSFFFSCPFLSFFTSSFLS